MAPLQPSTLLCSDGDLEYRLPSLSWPRRSIKAKLKQATQSTAAEMANKWLFLFFTCLACLEAGEPRAFFKPPREWSPATPESPHVKALFLEKSRSSFPASVNLATEPVTLTLKEYLKVVQELYRSKPGVVWREIGKIETRAGEAALTEIETQNQWGTVKMVQMLFLKEGLVHIVTTAALKNEYSKHYQEFYKIFKSFNVASDPLDILGEEKRGRIEQAIEKMQRAMNCDLSDFDTALQDKLFQKKEWKPFQTMLAKEFEEHGIYWQALMLDSAQNMLSESFSNASATIPSRQN